MKTATSPLHEETRNAIQNAINCINAGRTIPDALAILHGLLTAPAPIPKVKTVKPPDFIKVAAQLFGGRSTLPILARVRVLNGRASCTDMETALTFPAPEGTADGIYIPLNGQLVADPEFTGEDYPPLPGPERYKDEGETSTTEDGGEFDGGELFDALQALEAFQSTDETRYILNGVLFRREEGAAGAVLVATDGRRLHHRTLTVTGGGAFDFVLPAKAIKTLLKVRGAGAVELAITETDFLKAATLSLSNGAEIVSKTIEGTYPNYKQVIPPVESDKIRFSVDAGDWLDTIKELAPTAKHVEQDDVYLTFNQSGAVEFEIISGLVGFERTARTVSGATVGSWEAGKDSDRPKIDPATGEQEKDRYRVYWEQDPADTTRICFNMKLLSDILKTGPDAVRLTDELNPAVFYKQGDTENRDGESVLMPLRCS